MSLRTTGRSRLSTPGDELLSGQDRTVYRGQGKEWEMGSLAKGIYWLGPRLLKPCRQRSNACLDCCPRGLSALWNPVRGLVATAEASKRLLSWLSGIKVHMVAIPTITSTLGSTMPMRLSMNFSGFFSSIAAGFQRPTDI